MKRLSALILAVIMCALIICSFTVTVSAESIAYEINELNMSIPVPDNMIVLTRDSKETDPFFTEFNVNYDTTMAQLIDADIYLEGVDKKTGLTLTVTMTRTKESTKIGSYNSLSDEELAKIMEQLRSIDAYKDASPVEYKSIKYICLNMSYKNGKKTVQAQQYNTVMNGENINITMQAVPGKKLTTANKEVLADIISGTTILEDNFFTRNRGFILYGSITLLAVALVVAALIFLLKYIRNPNRKHKLLVHELAHEHKITETTEIPRKHILSVTKPTNSFLTKYDPVDELGKKRKKKKSETAAEEMKGLKTHSEPVPEEALEEPVTEVSYDAAPDEIAVPLESNEIKDVIAEAEAETIAEEAPEEPAEPEVIENETVEKPEEAEAEVIPEETSEPASEEPDLEEIFGVPAEQVEVSPEESDEKNFSEAADYFDEDPDEGEMYSYQDVNTAVKDYSRAKLEDEEIEEDIPRAWDTVKHVLAVIGRGAVKVLKALGIGLVKVFKAIGVGLVFAFTHIKYFCINLHRTIKRNRADKKRRKAEEERRRQASERRRTQREAERARQRNNAQRGENDLVQVRSSRERYERRPAPSDRERVRSDRSRQARPTERSRSNSERARAADRNRQRSQDRRSSQSRNNGQRRF